MTAAAAVFFRHEIESPQPLRAPAGRLELKGWCLAPHVRLQGKSVASSQVSRIDRPDVAQAIGTDTVAASGFAILARLRPGAHLLILEASADGNDWHPVRELCVVASAAELQAAIEWPDGPVVCESVRIQGWCVHPDFPLAEVWLHYGNRQVRCEYGLPRTDVPGLFPGVPGTTRAGFIATKNIPAGYGPLRIRGVTATGESFFTETALGIDIDRDEENPAPLDLHGRFPELGPARRQVAPRPNVRTTAASLRILFVLYGDFTSNSAIHVTHLANALIGQGHECVVAVPQNAETVRYQSAARFPVVPFAAIIASPGVFPGGHSADLVHAWTTRENVRQFCAQYQATRACPVVVHLEDHELRILEASIGRSLATWPELPPAELDRLVPPALSHPRRSRAFLEASAGVTVILDRLRELVPAAKPVQVIWPAADETAFFSRPIPWAFRQSLGWNEAHTVLFYHGNVHATNQAEVRELYAAVAQLNESGVPTTLIRTGRDDGDFLGDLKPRVTPHVINLGQVDHHHHLPALMALADFFVQPGAPDAFNDYRFPSKLPEFFALGRPVILPRTNLGAIVRHGEDAWVLAQADAAAIVAAVRHLRADPALCTRLGEGAGRFAASHFNWPRSGKVLAGFYNSLLSRA